MSKKKPAENRTSTLSVKLHMDVIETARIVAAYRNVTITDLLSNIVRPVLLGMEREEIAKRARRTEAEKGEGPGSLEGK